MFLKSISFKKNIVFESNRISHDKMFKVKTKKYLVDDRRKPIYHKDKPYLNIGYEKRTVTERTFTIFKKGLTIDFNGNVTIIVGDNGCGKTSLIKNLVFPKEKLRFKGLVDDGEKYEREIVSEWLENSSRKLTFEKQPTYVIVEKDIHKNSHIDTLKNSKTVLDPSSVLQLFDMQEFSNGENNLDFLNGLKGIKNGLIVLDEPETSLSIKSQYKVINLIKELAVDNQLIIVTHSENLMKLTDNVYDFEKKRYINTKKYIASQII